MSNEQTIPWKKPEERPEDKSEVVFISVKDGRMGILTAIYWGGLFCWYTSGDEWKAEDEASIVAWVYRAEMPLPEWIKK